MSKSVIKAGFVMLQIDDINVAKDTSLALLLAAQDKNWRVDFIQVKNLWIDQGTPGANVNRIKVWDDVNKWCELEAARRVPLSDYDVLMIRIDPPVNNDYIYATQILERAQELAVRVVNSPAAIRDFNEKIFATKFPQLMPAHLLSADIDALSEFHHRYDATVFKPLDAMGGQGIFMLQKGDMNLRTVLEGLTNRGQHLIMAQEYIPDIIKGGDKRVLLFYGEPYPKILVRLPTGGDFRANLAVGGNYLVKDIGEDELKVCKEVAPFMHKQQLDFVGLDIIGGYLSEINITCPTGLRQLAANHDEDPARFFLDKLEESL